jgi:hypothetical protein
MVLLATMKKLIAEIDSSRLSGDCCNHLNVGLFRHPPGDPSASFPAAWTNPSLWSTVPPANKIRFIGAEGAFYNTAGCGLFFQSGGSRESIIRIVGFCICCDDVTNKSH